MNNQKKKVHADYVSFPDVIDKVYIDVDENYKQIISMDGDSTDGYIEIKTIDKTTGLTMCADKLNADEMVQYLRVLGQLNNQFKKKK